MKTSIQKKTGKYLFIASLILLGLPYALYIYFLVGSDQTPVDYTTFMSLGENLIEGKEIYGENAYYPLPFVAIFSFFRSLPRELGIILWFSTPPILALFIVNWNPLILLYAPLFSHFVGGQASVLGMIGLWGYRRNSDLNKWGGGVWLAITLLKPQLGIFPVTFALYKWIGYLRQHRKMPLQSLGFLGSSAAVFVPSLLWKPNWPLQWLSTTRPLFERALSGFIPRILLFFSTPNELSYWMALGIGGLLLLIFVYYKNKKRLSLDLLILWSFVASPLVHDYDLIQLIPLLDTKTLKRLALVSSLPGWVVVLTQYDNDAAWIAFTIIAPALLIAKLYSTPENG